MKKKSEKNVQSKHSFLLYIIAIKFKVKFLDIFVIFEK